MAADDDSSQALGFLLHSVSTVVTDITTQVTIKSAIINSQ
jgi:hypothetical protein